MSAFIDTFRSRCFSESLSSLRRPTVPITASPQNDLFSRLDPYLLGHVLSFVPNHEFFMLFPRLSHSHAYAFTEPVLHQSHCQSRFRWSDVQWKLFASSSWPQLALAVHKHELIWFELAASGDDKGDDSGNDDSADDDKIGASGATPAGSEPHDKDWSLECTHLYRYLRFTMLHLLQQAPNMSSTGTRIRYTLPRAIEAAVVDMLTSRSVLGVLEGRSTYASYHHIRFLSPSSSTCFRTRGDEVVLEVLDGVPSDSPWPSTQMETAFVSTAPLDDDVFSEFDHDRDPWNAVLGLDEAAMLGDVQAQGCGGSHFLHAIWFGPALRRAIDAHAAKGGDSDPHRCIEVDLEDSPIIELDLKNGDPLPRLIAENASAWVARGAIDNGYHGVPFVVRWLGRNMEETAAVVPSATTRTGWNIHDDVNASFSEYLQRAAYKIAHGFDFARARRHVKAAPRDAANDTESVADG